MLVKTVGDIQQSSSGTRRMLRVDIREDIRGLKEDIRGDILGIRGELGGLSEDLKEFRQELRQELKAGFASLESKLTPQ